MTDDLDVPMVESVGVVVSVLDAVDTVDAAIGSVRGELDGQGSRVVVVDGGSTDGTLQLLAGRNDIELVHQTGRGLAAARNQGLAALGIPTSRAAPGSVPAVDLVAFCDADDTWVAGGLGERRRHLRTHAMCGVVAGAVITRLVDGHQAPAVRREQMGRVVPGYTPGALLARSSVFGSVGGFDEGLRIASDSDWLARLSASGVRFDLLDDVSLVKGIRSTSLSTDVEQYRQELLSVVRDHLGAQRADGRGDP